MKKTFLFFILTLSIFSADFKQSTIKINDQIIHVELAITQSQRIQGFQNRQSLKDHHGMLFVYKKPQKLRFWMKNTFIPLSIAFIDENRIITQIEQMSPLSKKTIHSKKKCLYALEVNQGYFKNNSIKLNDTVILPAIEY